MSILSDRAVGLLAYLQDPLLQDLARGMLESESAERLSLVAHGDGDQIGPWAVITDPRFAELWSIAYAAQYSGGRLPIRRAGESDDDYLARAQNELLHPRGLLRGGAQGLVITALPFLSGSQSIRVLERPSGDLWSANVIVNPAQVADPAGLTAALNDPESLAAGFKIVLDLDDSPLIDEGTRTIDSVAGTVTIDGATIADIT